MVELGVLGWSSVRVGGMRESEEGWVGGLLWVVGSSCECWEC